jgi:hypothetical protein
MEMRKGVQIDMAPILEKRLLPSPVYPDQSAQPAESPHLEVSVVFTSVEATLPALKEAATLARSLSARITLVVPQVVPYPLPITSPPVLLDFNERRFATIVSKSRIDTTVRIYLCRDRLEALAQILRPRSLVVIGGRKRWWPSAEARLAKKLRRAGHDVVVVDTE